MNPSMSNRRGGGHEESARKRHEVHRCPAPQEPPTPTDEGSDDGIWFCPECGRGWEFGTVPGSASEPAWLPAPIDQPSTLKPTLSEGAT